MGQTIGRASVPSSLRRLLNLPASLVKEIWEAFNDLAEGFGLSIEEVKEILKLAVLDYFMVTEKTINKDAETCFRILDDDENNLIDSLEFISAVTLLSGMSPEDKIRFLFAMYDFEESGSISLDEMVLAFRASLSGVCKFSGMQAPTEAEIETIVALGFSSFHLVDEKDQPTMIGKDQFLQYCLNTPEVMSWIDFYDDVIETESAAGSHTMKNSLVDHIQRSHVHERIMNPSLGGVERLKLEKTSNDARKPWQNAVISLAPPKPQSIATAQPPHTFSIDWVYGYNAHTCRQNLFYTSKGLVLYAAAAICVIYDPTTHSQTHFSQHFDTITCLKSCHSETGTTVATGESGWRPTILVWDADSKSVLSALVGFHRNGILFLDFSPDTNKLVTMGGDEYHSLAVYKWRTREVLWSARNTQSAVNDVRYLDDGLIVSCGDHHVTFWKNVQGMRGFRRHRGDFGTIAKPEVMWCVAMVDGKVVTGAESGMMYVWEGRNLVRSIKAHADALMTCFMMVDKKPNPDKGLLTACRAGKVQIWNSALEICSSFNCTQLGPILNSIASVCWNSTTNRILIGFKTCEIFEIDAVDGRNAHKKPLVAAHFCPRVSGLAAHPDDPHEFCTVGDDKSVRVHSSKTHQLLRMSQMDTMGRCIGYSPDGQMLVIGLGSGLSARPEVKEGAFVVLSEEDLTIVSETRDTKDTITSCCFSPNQELIAIASLDGSILVYNSRDFVCKSRCKGHASGVSHIDFSSDSKYLMSNSVDGELLFWLADTGETQAPRSVRDVEWESNSCIYSLDSHGIWSSTADGIEYTMVCSSHALDLIAAADSMGRIKIMSYPAQKCESNYTLLKGHGANVLNCCFSCDDAFLYSSGGTDGTIIQWRVHLPEVSTSLENNARNHIVEEVLGFEASFIGKSIDRSDNFHFAMEDIPIPVCLYEEGLAETAPLLPWQRSIVGPSKLPTIEDLSEPPDSLELSYIYGFSVEISRQSLIYANDGDALFIAAAVVVKMNPVSRKQRFYTEHTCTVTALASQTDSSIVASGQRGEIPSIRIWDSSSFTTLIVISGFHRRAINHLQFSQDGKLLLAVGMDEMHSIGVYDWKNSLLLASSNGITNKSLAVSFFPSGTSLIQCGNEVIRFWDIEGINLKGQDAVLGGKAVIQGFLCIGWVGNTPVVGTCDGHLYRFIGRQLDGIIKAHEGPIFAIASHSNGICTCSSDGTIKSWARILECTHTISIKDLKSTSLDIRCLNWHPDGRVLFGTAVGDIFEIASDGRNIHRVALSEGHGGQELCGISMHPTLDLFATTGDDALLRVWDYVSHMATKTVRLEMPSRCCAFSPDGRKIAVGFGAPNNAATTKKFDGKWVLLETDDYQLVHEGRDSLKYLTDMKYSPNGEILAIGSSDNRIYLYNMFANNTLIATLGQHRSFITALDFSMDSGWLQSNCGGYDLNFYEADTGMYIPNATRMRDIQWASQTCTMGWSVQGLWTPFRDGSECTAADCNFSRRDDGVVVAGGDNFGRITLARHPCYESKAISKRYRYSSNPINRLRFTPNDAFLMAVSGADKIVMQFVHHREVSENLATDAIHREDNAEEGKDEVLSLMGLKSSAAADAVDAKVQIGGRTWIAYAIAPTAPPELITTKPALDIDMSHIIGLQNEMIRTNICLNADGDIISPTSKYICLFNKQSNLQVHYDQHLSTICCVAVSGDHALVASAERCSRPLIHVWSADTCQQIVKLPLLHRGGVGSIQFSADRRFILSVGLDDDRTIALWFSPSANWLDGHLSAWGKGDVQSVMFASFYSFGTTVAASGGSCHIKFWGVDGHCLNPTYAEYPHTVKLGLLTCGAQVGQLFITGSASGQLFVWKGHAYDRTIRAHDAYITGIFSDPSGSSILTISKDGIVHQWSKALEHMKNFSAVDADVAPIMKGLLSVDACLSSDGSSLMKVVVTTQSSEIYEVAAKSGNCFLLSEAHYFGELWGLAAHPTKPDVFATVGDDKTLRVWSASLKRLLRKAIIDSTARCVNWSPDGKYIIVGLGGSVDGSRQRKDGAYLIIDGESLKPIFEGRDSRHWIREAKFSPDSRSFALASMDHKIYIYSLDNYRLRGLCEKHNSYIRNFDFSVDGKFIQSDSGDYEHLYFEATDGAHYSLGSNLRDLEWAGWSCTFGWPVLGVWPKQEVSDTGMASLAAEPTCVHRSHGKLLLAVGCTNGDVKIYNYPCISREAIAVCKHAHVGEVSNVRFTSDDKHVISIGRVDRAIIVWSISSGDFTALV